MLSPQFIASLYSDPNATGYVEASKQLQGALRGIGQSKLERARLAEQTRANQAGEAISRGNLALGGRNATVNEGSLALNREEFQAKKDAAAAGALSERQTEFAKFQERYNDAIGRLDGGKTEQLKLEGQAKGYQFGEVSEGGKQFAEPRTPGEAGMRAAQPGPSIPAKKFLTVSDPASKASVKIDPEGLRAARDQTFDTIFKGAVTYNQPLWQEALQLARVGSPIGMEAPKAAEIYMNLREQQNKLDMVKANKRGGGGGAPGGGAIKSSDFDTGRRAMMQVLDKKGFFRLSETTSDLGNALAAVEAESKDGKRPSNSTLHTLGKKLAKFADRGVVTAGDYTGAKGEEEYGIFQKMRGLLAKQTADTFNPTTIAQMMRSARTAVAVGDTKKKVLKNQAEAGFRDLYPNPGYAQGAKALLQSADEMSSEDLESADADDPMSILDRN